MKEKLIYVVDDEMDIREMECTFLENEGYKVETFGSADEVMELLGLNSTAKPAQGFSSTKNSEAVRLATSGADEANRRCPDLIVMDIMMPGTDGLTACSRLRKSEDVTLQVVPIILVSAKDTPLDRVTGLTMGSDDYLVKPFLPLELVARVKALLRRSEMLSVQAEENIDNSRQSLLVGDDSQISDGQRIQANDLQTVDKKLYTCGNLSLDFAAHRVYVDSVDAKDAAVTTDVQVTPMEFDFVHYLILRKETAVSKAELLTQIWQLPDAELQDDVRMTDDLVKRLRKKLTSVNSTARVETVWGFGYRLTEN